jgi:hypothetical protein
MEEIMTFDLDRVNCFVLKKQHLTEDSRINDINQIVEDICGLHATHPMTPYLSLFIRTGEFSREDLDEELYIRRSLAKIRYARKTVYILPKQRVSEVFSATRGMLEQRLGPYLEHLGMTGKDFKESAELILTILENRGLTVNGLKKEINADFNVSAVVNLMCDQGLLIRGSPAKGWKSSLHTYYSFSEYFPDIDLSEVNEEDAKRSMVKKYLATFGPVSVTDASWWTGFTKTEIKSILNDFKNDITSLKISSLEGEYVLLASDRELLESTGVPKNPQVRLMPLLDPYLMGYKERKRYLTQEHYTRVFDRSGNVTSTVLVDGQISGIWDIEEGHVTTVKIFLFSKVSPDVKKQISSKAKKIGRFISGKDVRVQRCQSMVPLTERTMGGFMSPLKGCSEADF